MVPYDVGPLQLRDLGNQFTGSKDPHWLHAAGLGDRSIKTASPTLMF